LEANLLEYNVGVSDHSNDDDPVKLRMDDIGSLEGTSSLSEDVYSCDDHDCTSSLMTSSRSIFDSPLHDIAMEDIPLPSYYMKHCSVSDDEDVSRRRPRRITYYNDHVQAHYQRRDTKVNDADAIMIHRLQHSLEERRGETSRS